MGNLIITSELFLSFLGIHGSWRAVGGGGSGNGVASKGIKLGWFWEDGSFRMCWEYVSICS